MKPPNWDRIQEIYHAALALPRSERSTFVANACVDDLDVGREVSALLKAADLSNDFLEVPVINLGSVPDDLVGTTIGGRYLIERELGRGGMSQVYFARDLNLQSQAVVIKVLSSALVQDSYARQKFKQEVEALLRIDHPGVVRVLDTGELAEGRPYIVMQHVEGETLRSRIPTEGMDLKHAASILKQIGAALERVHEKRIFHRDLKPENIMIKCDTDSVVLIDFGIAKVKNSEVAPSTAHGASAGTLRYMSPEQLSGEEITAVSDIYSMAVIAYELVTGRLPFQATLAAHLLELQKARAWVKPMHLRQTLSAKAQATMLRALSFEPKARYQSAEEFGDNLARALLDNEKEARGNRSLAASSRKWLAGITTLIILVGAIALFAFHKGCVSEPEPRSPRTFSYWLTIQRMRDGQDYQDPFKSNDDAVFESGDKFRLGVSSPDPGYLYVVNEGSPAQNETSFALIYPNQVTNNGSASLGANQSVQSDWIIFRGPPGAENFWIVWSASPVGELESAKSEAFKHANGGLTGQTLVTVKEYLKAKQSETKVKTIRYKETQKAVVRGPGDMLLTLAQFKHR